MAVAATRWQQAAQPQHTSAYVSIRPHNVSILARDGGVGSKQRSRSVGLAHRSGVMQRRAPASVARVDREAQL
jgi:hypothetical protein